jgi:hypothetical protein
MELVGQVDALPQIAWSFQVKFNRALRRRHNRLDASLPIGDRHLDLQQFKRTSLVLERRVFQPLYQIAPEFQT